MMAERGIGVDHSTVHRWVIKLVPLFEKTFCKHKYPVGKSWRMDETSSCALSVMPCWSACIPGQHSRRRPLYVTDADPRPACSAHPALHPGVAQSEDNLPQEPTSIRWFPRGISSVCLAFH